MKQAVECVARMIIQKKAYHIKFTAHRERYGNHTRTMYEDIEIHHNRCSAVISGGDLNERNYLRILNEIKEG